MKRNNAGFTFAELMTAIAIIAILSTIAVPNMIGWRERAKLRGAFENLKGDLQWAKVRAIRDHGPVAVVFESGRYEVNDAAGATIRSRQLSAGAETETNIDMQGNPNGSNFIDRAGSGGQRRNGGTYLCHRGKVPQPRSLMTL